MRKMNRIRLLGYLEDARQEGVREVVEWIEKKRILTPRKDYGDGQYHRMHFTMEEWQAKLKEWGINEGEADEY